MSQPHRKLTDAERLRFSRNLALKEVGEAGQLRLFESRVLIIGAGGLGSPVALYLAAAGAGQIGLADSDKVDLSNLQRQILHGTPDIGRAKPESAAEKLMRINPDLRCQTHALRIDAGNIDALILDYDFILDCTDNFASKFLINDACVKHGKPFSHAGVSDFRGQAFTYAPGHACLRCLFKEPPLDQAVPSTAEVGILGGVAGVVGALQAVEAVKWLTRAGECLLNRIWIVDFLGMQCREAPFKRDPLCAVCSASSLQSAF
jgi:molybdopterin-synthase adenylyltransferase